MLDKVMIAHTEMNKYLWFSHTDRHRYSKKYREAKIDTNGLSVGKKWVFNQLTSKIVDLGVDQCD